jgi:hypothetical protein
VLECAWQLPVSIPDTVWHHKFLDVELTGCNILWRDERWVVWKWPCWLFICMSYLSVHNQGSDFPLNVATLYTELNKLGDGKRYPDQDKMSCAIPFYLKITHRVIFQRLEFFSVRLQCMGEIPRKYRPLRSLNGIVIFFHMNWCKILQRARWRCWYYRERAFPSSQLYHSIPLEDQLRKQFYSFNQECIIIIISMSTAKLFVGMEERCASQAGRKRARSDTRALAQQIIIRSIVPLQSLLLL